MNFPFNKREFTKCNNGVLTKGFYGEYLFIKTKVVNNVLFKNIFSIKSYEIVEYVNELNSKGC